MILLCPAQHRCSDSPVTNCAIMSVDNWTVFGEFPAPVKLEQTPEVIKEYLKNQDTFVRNQQLMRVSAKNQQRGFIIIRVNKTWQLAKVLGRISEDAGDFSAWPSFNNFFVLQLYEECTPTERVLAKLDDNVDNGSAWESFHHLFSRAWLKTFVDRQHDLGHWANKYDSPTIVSRGEPNLDEVFEEIDSFHKDQSKDRTELEECIVTCRNLFSLQINPGDKTPSFFCVDFCVEGTSDGGTEPSEGDDRQHITVAFPKFSANQVPTTRAQMSPKISRSHLHRAAKSTGNKHYDEHFTTTYNSKVVNQTNENRTETPVFEHPASVKKVPFGHGSEGSYTNPPFSETSDVETFAYSANIVNLFFDLQNPSREESMRHFQTPVHCKHVFNVMVRQFGPQRPEMKDLAEFCDLSRKVYLRAKLLKIRMENKDGLFSAKHVQKCLNEVQQYTFELKQSFTKMCIYCCNLPAFFDNPGLSKFVDLLLDYFDESTGQHTQFTEVISSLIDQALEALSNYVEKSESDNNSFVATPGYEHVAGGCPREGI